MVERTKLKSMHHSILREVGHLRDALSDIGLPLILLKGANAANEIAAAEKQIRRFRLSDVHVEVVGEGVVDEPTRVIRATVR